MSWKPSATSEAAKSTAPATIHGRRRPNRDVVRSESAPVSGNAISAQTAEMPEMTPKESTSGSPAERVVRVGLRSEDVLDLRRQQELERRELRHPHSEPGGAERGDPSAGDEPGRLGER